MKYAFYPGCALSATALPYGMSTLMVIRELGMDMPELEDWNCCGTTVFQTLDEVVSLSLSGRNLALVEKSGSQDLVTPCSGCYFSLKKANRLLASDPEKREQVEVTLGEVGLSYDGGVRVRHLLDVLVDDVGLDAIGAKVTRPLTKLKVACYYGCLLTRPPTVTGAPHPENPTSMDRLTATLGAEPLDWSYKTECCGASYAVSKPELVATLTGRILGNAREVGADMVVVACPLCQSNLDMDHHHGDQEPLPVVYFTELMGLAFGLSHKPLGLDRHFRDPIPTFCRHNLVTK